MTNYNVVYKCLIFIFHYTLGTGIHTASKNRYSRKLKYTFIKILMSNINILNRFINKQ